MLSNTWNKTWPLLQNPWAVRLALLVGIALSYGVFIPWFGLYGDDWIYLYAYHVGGADFFIPFVAWDRPFSAWIYLVITPLLGENVLFYHLFLLGLRWLGAVLLEWTLRMVWPQRVLATTAIAFLFAVYPGFRQQTLPLEFVLHLSSLALFLLSLGWMLLALQREAENRTAHWFMLGALVCAVGGIFPIEYFFGLELLRPVLIWMVAGKRCTSWRQRAVYTAKHWLPYLVVVLVFLVWRVFIFGFPSYKPVDASSGLWNTLLGFLPRMALDIKTALLDAWLQVFQLPVLGSSSGQRYYGLVVIAFVLAGLFFKALSEKRSNDDDIQWSWQPVLLGVFALLVAGWPFWIPDVPVKLSFPWDRSTLAFMLGVSLVLVGVISMIIRRHFQVVLLAGLFALAVGSHYQNARFYSNEWQNLNTFFWQLQWRAPGIKPGTLLLMDNPKLSTVSDNDLTPALNWMYAPDRRSPELFYKIFDLDLRYQSQNIGLAEMKKGVPVDHINRSLHFMGNTSQALVVYYNSSACLRVLDEQDALLPGMTELLRMALPLSNKGQIDPDVSPVVFPPFMEGEPEHNWCYYFQKAELARQKGDWQQVSDLGDQAATHVFVPVDKSEYLPFIEASARLGNWEKAQSLAVEVAESDVTYRPALCSTWNRLEGELKSNNIQMIKTRCGCDG